MCLCICATIGWAQVPDQQDQTPEVVSASQTLTLKQAVARVQRQSAGKILSARRIQTRNGPMFRIKVLTRTGRVRVVQIAESEPPSNVTKGE